MLNRRQWRREKLRRLHRWQMGLAVRSWSRTVGGLWSTGTLRRIVSETPIATGRRRHRSHRKRCPRRIGPTVGSLRLPGTTHFASMPTSLPRDYPRHWQWRLAVRTFAIKTWKLPGIFSTATDATETVVSHQSAALVQSILLPYRHWFGCL